MEKSIKKNESISGDYIDLLEVFRLFYKERYLIIKSVAIFIILGIIIALTSTVKYLSHIRFIPEGKASAQNDFSTEVILINLRDLLNGEVPDNALQREDFLKISTGAEIIVPPKPKREPLSAQEWIAISTSVATLAV